VRAAIVPSPFRKNFEAFLPNRSFSGALAGISVEFQ